MKYLRALFLFAIIQTLFAPMAQAFTCRSVFYQFSPETRLVIDYTDQVIEKNQMNFLLKKWKVIGSKLNKNKTLISSKKLLDLLEYRSASSATLNGANGEKNQRSAIKNFLFANKFLLKSLNTSDISIDFIKVINSIHRTGRVERAQFRNIDVTLGGISLNKMVSVHDVEASMEDLVLWYHHNVGKLHPIELAARFYQKLISIHPFEDGNGRTSRDIMDFILMKHGYPPAVFDGKTVFSSAIMFGLINPPKGYPKAQTPDMPIVALTEAVLNSINLLENNH